jgi:3-phosphoglycerate kinase
MLKFEAIPNLVKIMDEYTAGVAGILTAHLSGHEVGPENEEFLKSVFKCMEKELSEYRRIVEDYKIRYPLDFVLSQSNNLSKNNRINVKLKDLNKPENEDYQIYDIDPLTVKEYSKMINSGEYDWRIRAGPNGAYEEDSVMV